eukprot:TRINITY_DN2576_c0_g1_i1.p1 TRINITY_DN2576_c0_g1~~TRINITY_DN2576_c0_g1_i1.p1  ORF type:complete len:925 (+),score=497.94 TRINITY_DN2576_c0_g1_i1:260-2776(+)
MMNMLTGRRAQLEDARRYWCETIKAQLMAKFEHALTEEELKPTYDLGKGMDVWWIDNRLQTAVGVGIGINSLSDRLELQKRRKRMKQNKKDNSEVDERKEPAVTDEEQRLADKQVAAAQQELVSVGAEVTGDDFGNASLASVKMLLQAAEQQLPVVERYLASAASQGTSAPRRQELEQLVQTTEQHIEALRAQFELKKSLASKKEIRVMKKLVAHKQNVRQRRVAPRGGQRPSRREMLQVAEQEDDTTGPDVTPNVKPSQAIDQLSGDAVMTMAERLTTGKVGLLKGRIRRARGQIQPDDVPDPHVKAKRLFLVPRNLGRAKLLRARAQAKDNIEANMLLEDAREQLEKVGRLRPDDVESHTLLGETFAAQAAANYSVAVEADRLTEAAQLRFRTACELRPQMATSWLLWSRSALQSMRWASNKKTARARLIRACLLAKMASECEEEDNADGKYQNALVMGKALRTLLHTIVANAAQHKPEVKPQAMSLVLPSVLDGLAHDSDDGAVLDVAQRLGIKHAAAIGAAAQSCLQLAVSVVGTNDDDVVSDCRFAAHLELAKLYAGDVKRQLEHLVAASESLDAVMERLRVKKSHSESQWKPEWHLDVSVFALWHLIALALSSEAVDSAHAATLIERSTRLADVDVSSASLRDEHGALAASVRYFQCAWQFHEANRFDLVLNGGEYDDARFCTDWAGVLERHVQNKENRMLLAVLKRLHAIRTRKFVSCSIEYGNTCKQFKSLYRWSLFVRGVTKEDEATLRSVVDKIIIHLHPSFARSREILTEAPFRIFRRGWGAFPVTIVFVFREPFADKNLTLRHDLSLNHETNGEVTTKLLTLASSH